MKWEELVEKQANDYGDLLEAAKTSREKLDAGKKAVLETAKCSETDLPAPLKDMLQRNEQNWEKEYGMYGTRFKEMRIVHQRELKKFFEHEALTQDLTKDQTTAKEKAKD